MVTHCVTVFLCVWQNSFIASCGSLLFSSDLLFNLLSASSSDLQFFLFIGLLLYLDQHPTKNRTERVLMWEENFQKLSTSCKLGRVWNRSKLSLVGIEDIISIYKNTLQRLYVFCNRNI